MKVEDYLENGMTRSGSALSRSGSADEFKSRLAEAGQSGGAAYSAKKAMTAEERAKAAAAADAELVKYLQDYVKKSPAEHLREAVLKQMGLTEEDLAAMPTEKRLATEAEINRRIREKLLGHKESEDPAAGDLPPASAQATAEGSGGAVASPVADQLNDAMAA